LQSNRFVVPSARTGRGVSAPEVIVLVLIAGLTALFLLVLLSRQRESARLAGCQQNLMEIGNALALRDGTARRLPTVDLGGDGPLKTLLVDLGVPDLRGLDPRRPPSGATSGPIAERPVLGFFCASDPNALAGLHPAPVSYRATTGDQPGGRNGAFAPGRRVSLAAIEAADGSSFTALFSERLVGDHRQGAPALWNYAVAAGTIPESGCPDAPASAWQGDAGSSWVKANWRNTLYTHALTPDASPSCVADDGLTALLGASSGHTRGVNVLCADISVRTFTPRVDPRIWREWAAFHDPEMPTPTPAP
jgi:hypothetical protein